MGVTICPCPQEHHAPLPVEAIRLLQRTPDMVTVSTGDESFRIPRAYIAYHGVKAREIPALAMKYGWEKVRG
jgi:hypothetical protein